MPEAAPTPNNPVFKAGIQRNAPLPEVLNTLKQVGVPQELIPIGATNNFNARFYNQILPKVATEAAKNGLPFGERQKRELYDGLYNMFQTNLANQGVQPISQDAYRQATQPKPQPQNLGDEFNAFGSGFVGAVKNSFGQKTFDPRPAAPTAAGNLGAIAGSLLPTAAATLGLGAAIGATGGAAAAAPVAAGSIGAASQLAQQGEDIFAGNMDNVNYGAVATQGALDAATAFIPALGKGIGGRLLEAGAEGATEAGTQAAINAILGRDLMDGTGENFAAGSGVSIGLNLAEGVLKLALGRRVKGMNISPDSINNPSIRDAVLGEADALAKSPTAVLAQLNQAEKLQIADAFQALQEAGRTEDAQALQPLALAISEEGMAASQVPISGEGRGDVTMNPETGAYQATVSQEGPALPQDTASNQLQPILPIQPQGEPILPPAQGTLESPVASEMQAPQELAPPQEAVAQAPIAQQELTPPPQAEAAPEPAGITKGQLATLLVQANSPKLRSLNIQQRLQRFGYDPIIANVNGKEVYGLRSSQTGAFIRLEPDAKGKIKPVLEEAPPAKANGKPMGVTFNQELLQANDGIPLVEIAQRLGYTIKRHENKGINKGQKMRPEFSGPYYTIKGLGAFAEQGTLGQSSYGATHPHTIAIGNMVRKLNRLSPEQQAPILQEFFPQMNQEAQAQLEQAPLLQDPSEYTTAQGFSELDAPMIEAAQSRPSTLEEDLATLEPAMDKAGETAAAQMAQLLGGGLNEGRQAILAS